MTRPPLAAGTRTSASGSSGFDRESARLRLQLADQLEHNRLSQAQETVVALLCLNPNDADALSAREFIEAQLAEATTYPVGEIHRLNGHQSAVNTVAISPDGRLALSGGGMPSGAAVFRSRIDYSVRLWELKTGRELRPFKLHSSMVTAVAFSPDSHRALSAAQEGGVFVWDVDTAQVVAHIGKRLPHVFAALFSADGKQVFTASADKIVRLWDLASGERVNRYQGHRREVTALALSADGKQLLTGCLDGEVWLWDVKTGQVTRRAGGHTKCVYCVAFSPDAKYAVSGGADQTARIWDLATGTQTQLLVGHTYTVCGVAYTPDGEAVLTGGDHTVRLWNAASGKEIKCFEGHSDSVRSVVCAPHRNRALSGARDGSVRYWQLPGDRAPTVVTQTVDRLGELPGLSGTEWVTRLRRCQILQPEWERELVDHLATRYCGARQLLNQLVERGWLTEYQVRQLAEDHGEELRLGNYVLLAPLGAGGAGHVFKARRWGTADAVALKIVKAHQDTGPAAFKQFMSEIQALAKMNHPNIIRAYEAGIDNKGRHFFTMESVDGSDLGKLVDKYGPMPVDRACRYLRQAAFGLQHAHEHCLIHRDIKPANLLLTVPSAQRRPGLSGNWAAETAIIKILDWGLAGLRAAHHQGQSSDDLLDFCSLDYVAPEQALDTHAADIRSDIYSLGCTLYHLLTGKPPFHGCTSVQKLNKQMTEYPPPLSTVRPDVPAALQAVLRKMIDKKPEERFKTPAAVVTALAPFCKK